MSARSGIVWLLVLAPVAAGVAFALNIAADGRREQLAELERQLAESRDVVRVLRAEWHYLSRPERVAELTRRHLELAPMAAAQMVPASALPYRAQPAAARAGP